MFGRKECKRCGEKSSGGSNFCSNCGVPFNAKKAKAQDLGMLGENDFEEDMNEDSEISNSLFGGIGEKVMGKMFESAVRMLEKEMQREMKRTSQNPGIKPNFQMFINGEKINIGAGAPQKASRKKTIPAEKLPNTSLKKFSELPKMEPETNVRRFSDRIIYEIEVPGVKSEKDISIAKLENSIEIKAVGNNTAYKKIIAVDLPITDFKITQEKLVLELGLKE